MNELTQSQIEALYENCYSDPVLFAYTFLPNWFPVKDISEITWFQRGILAVLLRKASFLLKYGELDRIADNFTFEQDGKTHSMFEFGHDAEGKPTASLVINKFTNIYTPRGFTKTTLINTTTLHKALYRSRHFSVYISEAAYQAEMQLNSVKAELSANKLIQLIFGDLVPKQRSGKKWRDDFIQLNNGVSLAAKGRGMQVRGMNDAGQRPDDIVLDDVESKDSVSTEAQRLKARTWLYADVLPALPIADTSATLTAVGTLLHQQALMVTMESDPRFHTIKLGAVDKKGKPLWEKVFPQSRIDATRKAFVAAGQLNSFMMEYFTTARDEETSIFKERYIIHKPPEGKMTGIGLAMDPAISNRPGADATSIAVVGMQDSGLIIVLECWSKVGATPREQIDKFFELYSTWQPSRIGIEAIAYQKALIHLVREEMFRRHCYFEIQEITHGRTAKNERVEGVLQPRYAAGYIHHARRFPTLETELLDWPNGKKDNPDAVAMAITLLDPYAAQAADPSIDLAANEYKPMETQGWAV